MTIGPREIRFATTDDGIAIAFWEIGSGSPLIIVHNLSINHIEAEWTVPSIASFYTELADTYRVIRLDARGSGMSENPFPALGTTPTGAQVGMTIDDMGLDVGAVAAASGLDTFALMAIGSVGPVGLEFGRSSSRGGDPPDPVRGGGQDRIELPAWIRQGL